MFENINVLKWIESRRLGLLPYYSSDTLACEIVLKK